MVIHNFDNYTQLVNFNN